MRNITQLIECQHLGKKVQIIDDKATGKTTEFYACKELKICSPTVDGFKDADGKEIALCSEDCPVRKLRSQAVAARGEKPAIAQKAKSASLVYLEPVGDKLHELLKECGINRPVCGECARWRKMMNEWGCSGCEEHRPEIIERLDKEAKAGTWLEALKVASGGYFSTTALLNEAIKRSQCPLARNDSTDSATRSA